MDDECWVLYDFVDQGGECACEWHADGAMSGVMGRKGEYGKGDFEGSNRYPYAVLLGTMEREADTYYICMAT